MTTCERWKLESCSHFQIYAETKTLNHHIVYQSETSPILSCPSMFPDTAASAPAASANGLNSVPPVLLAIRNLRREEASTPCVGLDNLYIS